MSIWYRYVQFYLRHFTTKGIEGEEGLPYLRDKLFIYVLLATLPICFLAYIPGMIASVESHQFVIGFFDTLSLLLIIGLFLAKRISINTRKILFSLVFYILSLVLLFFIGIKGPGPVILMSISILVTLYKSRIEGLIAVLANSFIYLIYLVILPLLSVETVSSHEYPLVSAIGISASLISFNWLTVIAVSYLVDHLNDSLINERELKENARKKETEIRDLNNSLEQRISERTIQINETNEKLRNEIQEHIKTERELFDAKIEAEKANRTKSDFLANMSHEIRTPMNAILGYSELLALSLREPAQKEYLGYINSSGKTLLNLINDILDLSKIESGKLELKFDFFDCVSYFTDIEKIFSFRILEKKLRFSFIISENIPTALLLDGDRLKQVFVNLIGNAVKFTEKGGVSVHIDAVNRHSGNNTSDETGNTVDLVIKVADTGVGINKEYHEEIFNTFFQVSSRTNKGGAGLGLAITRRLVQMMHGSISVESAPGEGTTFTVILPGIEYRTDFKSADRHLDFDPSVIVFRKATVLVVDDISVNRSYIKSLLSDTDLTVIECSDAYEGLAVMEEQKPDLVIADIVMPGLDGYMFLEEIKKRDSLRNIPVIAYSASVMKEERDKILSHDFSGLLVKPVSPEEIYGELMRVLEYSLLDIPLPKDEEKIIRIDGITDLPGLIFALDGELTEIYSSFEKKQPMGEVRNFADRLIMLGASHKCSYIVAYGNELLASVDNFNVEGMFKLLQQFNLKKDALRKIRG
ncbi:MAG: ATP-binding protein [Bacteroidales bacterium]